MSFVRFSNPPGLGGLVMISRNDAVRMRFTRARGFGMACFVAAALVPPIIPLFGQAPGAELRLVTPEGHTRGSETASFSPDGRLVVTGSQDRTARIWEVGTGRELRRLQGHTEAIKSTEFSPDGRSILTASTDKTVRIWEVATGQELHRLQVHENAVVSAAFSPDGRSVITASYNTARIWEIATGRELRRLQQPEFLTSAAFSSDGRMVVTASWDDTARVWDVATGRVLQRVGAEALNSAAISPNGRVVITASDDSTARLWDVATGRELRRLEGHTERVQSARFSRDGRLAVTVSRGVRIFDVESGRELRHISGEDLILFAAFSPDGHLLVTTGSTGGATLWDVETGRELRRMRGHTASQSYNGQGFSAVLSTDGRLALTVSRNGPVRLWEVASGRELRHLQGRMGWVRDGAFSPDARLVVTASDDSVARLWDVATGRELRQMRGHTASVNSARFSSDGRMVVTASSDRTARIWEVATGREIRRLEGHSTIVELAAFSPDGNLVVTAPDDSMPRIWEVASGREIRRLYGHTTYIRSASFSPDGQFVITASWDAARIWNAATGREVHQLRGHSDINTAAFSPDGHLVVTAARDGTARIWDAATGSELTQLPGHTDEVLSAAFSSDGRSVLTTSGDAVKFFDVTSGTELWRRFQVDSADWVMVAPDGRFDGTENGMRRMHYARGLETIGLDAFFDLFYTPGLSGQQLMRAPYNGPDIRRGFQLPPAIRILSPKSGELGSGTSVVVAIEATDRGGGVEDLRLYHNGTLVGGGTRGLDLDTADDRLCPAGAACFTLELLAGMTNTLEATAYSRDRTEAERARVEVSVPGTAPAATLYVLSVGINGYTNPRYNLNYGRADAAAFADALREGASTIFARVHADTLFDSSATRAGITAGLASIAAQARPEDVFVFYYAGHGTTEVVDDSTRFFLVPTEVTQMSDPAQLTRSGISGQQLRALFEAVPARKKLMVLDACNSGEAVATFARRGAAEERAIAQLARSSGLFVMSSTDSDQFATEFAALGHGVLTYAVLSSLRGEPNDPRRTRTVREVVARAEAMVPDLSRQHRGQPQYPMVWSHGMDFPLVVK